ncbi:O-fucosyltransferase family protein [Sporobolomyces koalae]|uniref:O-fucosyltransferase family protein n=1 Tax=Sporobolomyces koalae TaxID=500713 RepID=UPI00317D0628
MSLTTRVWHAIDRFRPASLLTMSYSSLPTGSLPSSLDGSPVLEPPPSTKPRTRLQACIWVIVGFLLSSLLSRGAYPQAGSSTTRPIVVNCDRLERLAKDRTIGPPETLLGATDRTGVPGPAQLLSQQAPAVSLYDALRDDLRYLTADSWSGEVGQLLSVFSLLHLAQQTQRVAIVPSVWRDRDHYGSSSVRFGDLFDLEKFRRRTGTLFVEWSDVKPFNLSSSRVKNDNVGCISWNGFEDGRSFGDYRVSTTAWTLPKPYGFASDSVEGHILFDYDFSTRLEITRQVARETGRAIPRNMRSDQLLCYTNVWGMTRAGSWAPGTWWNTDYKDFEGVQSSQAGVRTLFHPSLRGDHPEFWSIGQHLDFTPAVWEVALQAVQTTLEVEDLSVNLITVHIRRGDFASWCPTGHDCVAPIERYREAVDEINRDLAEPATVLVTTDETSSEFRASIRELGWYVINHDELGTAALLQDRFGASSGWWDSAVDQAILSLGNSGFVGTLDSQVSLVSALRVASWNNGRTKFVQRPH